MSKQQCVQCSKSYVVSEQMNNAAESFHMPVSDQCFECLQKNHLLFRGEWSLYDRTCDVDGARIISIYNADVPFPVYCADHWNSDESNPLQFGQDIDWSKPFFEQYAELQRKVPRIALANINAENSEYCHSSYGNKNCYLIFGGDLNENALYGQLSMRNRDIMDCDYTNDSELCYMSADIVNCYGCRFAFNSTNCTDSYFINDCSGVTECILSVNLVNKSHYILNVPYSKVEYDKKKAEIFNGSYENLQSYLKQYLTLLDKRIVKYAHNKNSEQSSGDYISGSSYCINCYDVSNSQTMENCIFADSAKDCFETTMIGHNAERVYNSISPYQSNSVRCSSFIIDSHSVDYSELIMNSHDIFGSIGLRKHSFAILNKVYSENDYRELKQKLIQHLQSTGEWGRFFPKELSPFAYNESAAQSYYPLTEKEAVQQGYRWKIIADTEQVSQASSAIPDSIHSVLEDVLTHTISCEQCTKPFRIVSAELTFYKKHNLPLPHTCPRCRFQWRTSLRNQRHLWQRQCMCTQPDHKHRGRCAIEFETTYQPDRKEIVYCEECYQKEIY